MTGGKRINDYSKLWPVQRNAAGDKVCRRCEAELPKDRKSFCSIACSDIALIMTTPHGYITRVTKYIGHHCAVCDKDVQNNRYADGGWDLYRAEIHHITPIIEGGTNELKNLVVLCSPCHLLIHKARRMWQRILETGVIAEEPKNQMSLMFDTTTKQEAVKDEDSNAQK